MSASTSPQPHFVLALESVICWTLHGRLCKPGGALLLHKAETKDDRTPTGSSVVVENMRARLSLVTCWYCELAALLTARLTLFIKLNNFTHRFAGCLHTFNAIFAFTRCCTHVLRVCTYVTKNCVYVLMHVIITQLRQGGYDKLP